MDSDQSPSGKPAALPGRRAGVVGAEAMPDHPAETVMSTLDVNRLFRAERLRLCRTVRRHLGDPEEAADIVQEAFARLVQAHPPAALRTPAAYLQRIVRNLLRDRFKRAETRLTFCDVTTCEAEATTVPPDQGWQIDADDLMAGYTDAVASLSSRTREVFVLHRVDELRYREIAVRLGITVATVEYHMARALSHLAQALDH